MQSPLLEEHRHPAKDEAFVIEDGTGLLATGQCYFQRRGEVVVGPVSVLNVQTGAVLPLTAVDVPSIPAMPEMQRCDSSVIVLPSGLCSTATTVVVQPRRGTKKKRASSDKACIVVQGPCAEALPVAITLPPVAPGLLALRKGATWLLALSVAQICLLSPVATAAAVFGICASVAVLCSHDGGTRAARRVKMLATLSAAMTVAAILVTTLLFAAAMPATVRQMAASRARMCGGPPAVSTPEPAPTLQEAPAWAGVSEESDPAWSSLWNFPFRVRKSSSADPTSGGGTYFVLTTTTTTPGGWWWETEQSGAEIAQVEARPGADGARGLGEMDRPHASRGDTTARPPTLAGVERDACTRVLRLIWILMGVAFVAVVVGLQLAAGIAAAFVAREAAQLLRHAPVPDVTAAVPV